MQYANGSVDIDASLFNKDIIYKSPIPNEEVYFVNLLVDTTAFNGMQNLVALVYESPSMTHLLLVIGDDQYSRTHGL